MYVISRKKQSGDHDQLHERPGGGGGSKPPDQGYGNGGKVPSTTVPY